MTVAVLLTWLGDSSKLPACVDALKKNAEHELVLVDGNKHPELSESACLKRAMNLTDAEILFFTQIDTLVPPDWISRHLRWHEKYDLVSGVRLQLDKIGKGWNPILPHSPQFTQRPGLGITGANLSVKRSVIEKIGWPSIPRTWDVDLGFRAIKANIPFVIDPSIPAYHDHPLHSRTESFRKSFQYTRGELQILKQHYGTIFRHDRGRIHLSFEALLKDRYTIDRIVYRAGQLGGIFASWAFQ